MEMCKVLPSLHVSVLVRWKQLHGSVNCNVISWTISFAEHIVSRGLEVRSNIHAYQLLGTCLYAYLPEVITHRPLWGEPGREPGKLESRGCVKPIALTARRTLTRLAGARVELKVFV